MSEEAVAEVADVSATDAAPTDAPATPEAPAVEVSEESSAPSFDWADVRGQLTGGDESMEKVIGRYRSLDAFGKAFMAQRQKLSERAEPSIPQLGENPTEEQVAAYREAMGIPDSLDDYAVTFGEGFEGAAGDDDVLGNFKEHMHNRNVPPAAAQAAVEWYQQLVETDRQQKNENAGIVHEEASDALRAEWGREFEGNQNAIKSYLNEALGADEANGLREMRMEDGSYLMDNPQLLRLLVQPATDYMGTGMIAGDTATMAKTLTQRRDELLAQRLSDPQGYKSDAVQEELTSIYQKLDRMKK